MCIPFILQIFLPHTFPQKNVRYPPRLQQSLTVGTLRFKTIISTKFIISNKYNAAPPIIHIVYNNNIRIIIFYYYYTNLREVNMQYQLTFVINITYVLDCLVFLILIFMKIINKYLTRLINHL